jgi:hypothetical protein
MITVTGTIRLADRHAGTVSLAVIWLTTLIWPTTLSKSDITMIEV